MLKTVSSSLSLTEFSSSTIWLSINEKKMMSSWSSVTPRSRGAIKMVHHHRYQNLRYLIFKSSISKASKMYSVTCDHAVLNKRFPRFPQRMWITKNVDRGVGCLLFITMGKKHWLCFIIAIILLWFHQLLTGIFL